jgi:hypothetical protein
MVLSLEQYFRYTVEGGMFYLWEEPQYSGKKTVLLVFNKVYHMIRLYYIHLAIHWRKTQTQGVIDTDCTFRCKSNYPTIFLFFIH